MSDNLPALSQQFDVLHRPREVIAVTTMPQTAEQAHAAAKQAYKAMLHHAAAGEVYLTADAAAKFQNAAALAQMYELRQIRIALMRIAGPRRELNVTTPMDDERDWHPAVPDVVHDGFPVNGRRRPC